MNSKALILAATVLILITGCGIQTDNNPIVGNLACDQNV